MLLPSLLDEFFVEDLKTGLSNRSLLEHNNRFELVYNVPGLDKEDINLSVEGNILQVRAEKKLPESVSPLLKRHIVTSLKDDVYLSKEVDIENIKAKVEFGLLHIEVPKKVKNRKLININCN